MANICINYNNFDIILILCIWLALKVWSKLKSQANHCMIIWKKVIIFGVKKILLIFTMELAVRQKKTKDFFSLLQEVSFWGWKSFIAGRGRSYKHISPAIVLNFSYCAICLELSWFFDGIYNRVVFSWI